jgi:hypothetical protein
MAISGRIFRCLALLLGILAAGPSFAQASRTWISGVGDDANPCSRTAPCKTFPGAISKTASGGIINVLDPGGFGTVTITKSITLENVGEIGGITSGSVNAIIVNAVGATVVLRGLSVDGLGTGLAGIKVLNVGRLIVERCDIGNFATASPNGYGINFSPGSTASLFVRDTTIHDNGSAAGGNGGILVSPTGGTANVVLENTRIIDNTGFGIQVQGSAIVTLHDSVVSLNSGDGVVASSTVAATKLLLDHTIVSGNGGDGVLAQGAAALMQLSDSTITGNAQGIHATGGAVVLSFGNNRNFNNTINGAPSLTNPLQ